MTLRLAPHPAAELFPLMRSGDFTQFVEDIRFNGLLEPIVVADGPILDGRNRCNACLALDIAPLLVEWDGRGTPEAFVVSKNIQRRHLDVGQRAGIAADLSNMHRGNGPSQRGDRQICRSATSTSEAARLVNVSERAVRDARVVLRNGTPDETAAVTNGSETLNAVLRRVRDRKEPLRGGQARHTTPGIGIVADQGITADFVEEVAVICRATNEIQRLDIPLEAAAPRIEALRKALAGQRL